ncbi:MAG: DUF58 domain-containing protein [Clostridiales bacterium]|nr:DUF58 domain-containing protein [Clostridiales bacterium]
MNIWVLLLAVAVLVAVQRYLVIRVALPGIRYERRLSRKTACTGESIELVETLRNPRPVFIPWLRVESRISPYLRFGRQENLDVTGERYHRSVFSLAPFQQVRRRHQVTLTRRGVYDVGTVALTAGDLLSASSAGTDMRFDCKVTVYPALLGDEEMKSVLPYARNVGDMIVETRRMQDPFLVCGIRPYEAGDPPRDIHWSATARTGQMQVKVHDYTADTKLLVVLNGQLRPDQWGNVMDYEEDILEDGISLAATMMTSVLRTGSAAGFASNMPFLNEEGCALILPMAGMGREEEVLMRLAQLRIHQERSILNCLEELGTLRDLDIVILSAYDADPEMEERMQYLRLLNRSVTLVRLHKRGGKQA